MYSLPLVIFENERYAPCAICCYLKYVLGNKFIKLVGCYNISKTVILFA